MQSELKTEAPDSRIERLQQGELKVETLDSVVEFVEHAEQWNRLWESSEAYEATSRSEAIALWVRTFEASGDFRAIVIKSATGEFLGGIAFMVRTSYGLKTLTLTVNEWINCGELLISSNADAKEVTNKIVAELKREADVIEFDRIQIDAPRWRALASCLTDARQAVEVSRIQRVGMIDIGDDWDGYFQCLSGNHRSAVRRSEKKIRKNGDVQLLRLWNPEDDVLRDWMSRAFEIEHKSWKGANGSSILAAGMDDYFMREAINARDCGMLELWFLLLDDQPIAFEYCHLVKGNCHSYKIGYDEDFKSFGPGRQLRKMQLEYLSGNTEPATFALDTMGLLCSAKAKWVTRDYRIGRMTASLSFKGGLFARGQQLLRKIKNRIRPPHDDQADIALGGASFLKVDDES